MVKAKFFMGMEGAHIIEPFGTINVSHEITQMGRALLGMRGRRSRGGKSGKSPTKELDPARSGYPELQKGLLVNLTGRANASVFFDGINRTAFERRPYAVSVVPVSAFTMPEQVQEWMREALLGASTELKGLASRPMNGAFSMVDRHAGANSWIERAKRGEGFSQASYHFTNYRPMCTEQRGFYYAPGFMLMVKTPNLTIFAGSENGSGVEARVLAGGFDINALVDRENLEPVMQLTRAIRRHLFPQAGLGNRGHPEPGTVPNLSIVSKQRRTR